MIPRAIPRLGRAVAPIGFGGRGLDRDGERVLRAALDAGVDVVDVAPGWGDAEAIAGGAIRDARLRDRAVLVTQAPPDHRTVQLAVERSLRATRLDVLPLVLLAPWPADRLDAPDAPELRFALARLVREGKALAWGVSVDDPRDARAALDEPLVAAVHLPFHVADRRAGAILPAAAERGVGVIARRVLDGGLFDADTGLPFALAEPAVSCALVGTRDLAHLRHDLELG